VSSDFCAFISQDPFSQYRLELGANGLILTSLSLAEYGLSRRVSELRHYGDAWTGLSFSQHSSLSLPEAVSSAQGHYAGGYFTTMKITVSSVFRHCQGRTRR
jgi:hypothetical protein